MLALALLNALPPLDLPAVLGSPNPEAAFTSRWGEPERIWTDATWASAVDRLPSFKEALAFRPERTGDGWRRNLALVWWMKQAGIDGFMLFVANVSEGRFHSLQTTMLDESRGGPRSIEQLEKSFSLPPPSNPNFSQGHFETKTGTWDYNRMWAGRVMSLDFSLETTKAIKPPASCSIELAKNQANTIDYEGLPLLPSLSASLKLVGLANLRFKAEKISGESTRLVGALPGWDVYWTREASEVTWDPDHPKAKPGYCSLIFSRKPSKVTEE